MFFAVCVAKKIVSVLEAGPGSRKILNDIFLLYSEGFHPCLYKFLVAYGFCNSKSRYDRNWVCYYFVENMIYLTFF